MPSVLTWVFILCSILALARLTVAFGIANRIIHSKSLHRDITPMFYPAGVPDPNYRVIASSLVPLWRKAFYHLFGFDTGFASAMENTGLTARGFHIFQTGLTFGAVATITATEQSMVVPALPAQIPLVQVLCLGNRLGAPQAGIAIAHCRVIDATHIGVTWVNPTAGPVTPTAAETFSFALFW